MEKAARILVAGSETLVGRALIWRLEETDYKNLLTMTSPELVDAGLVNSFFTEKQIDYVFLSGGMSGGISANISCYTD